MQRRAPSDVSDYLEILRRRWAWIVVPPVVCLFLMLIISAKLPKTYRSDQVILVDPTKLPADLLKTSVGGDANDRLQIIQQQILSRTQLQKIIDQNKLYIGDAETPEDIVELMRKDISLELVIDPRAQNSRNPEVTAFRISYMGKSPQQAQTVTRQLGSLFIEQNLKFREAAAEGTTQFLDTELEKSRKTLQEQEEKIKEFKQRYMGALPEQQMANMQIASQMQAMLQANSEALSRAQQGKIYLQSQLELAKQAQPTSVHSQQLASMRAQLAQAEERYTPSHPDVIRLRGEIANLEKEEKDEGVNPHVAQIQSQLASTEAEIKNRTQRIAELEGRIRSIQGRVETLPLMEQQYQDLTRDHDVTKATYQQLLAKRNSAGTVASAEQQAQGEQFRVIDPANLPEKPTKPNMLQLNGGALGGGIALGLMLAMFKEVRDRSIRTDKELQYYVPGIPVLGVLPEVFTPETASDKKRLRLKKWAISGAAASFMVATIGFLMYRGTINFAWWF